MTRCHVFSSALTALAFLAGPGMAQDAALMEAARSYVASPGEQAMITELLSPQAVVAQIQQASPGMPAEVAQIIGGIAAEELGAVRAPLETAMIQAAAQTFTLEEIKALDAFYRTPEGTSVQAKMQPFMAAAMTLATPDLMAAQKKIMDRSVAALQAAEGTPPAAGAEGTPPAAAPDAAPATPAK